MMQGLEPDFTLSGDPKEVERNMQLVVSDAEEDDASIKPMEEFPKEAQT